MKRVWRPSRRWLTTFTVLVAAFCIVALGAFRTVPQAPRHTLVTHATNPKLWIGSPKHLPNGKMYTTHIGPFGPGSSGTPGTFIVNGPSTAIDHSGGHLPPYIMPQFTKAFAASQWNILHTCMNPKGCWFLNPSNGLRMLGWSGAEWARVTGQTITSVSRPGDPVFDCGQPDTWLNTNEWSAGGPNSGSEPWIYWGTPYPEAVTGLMNEGDDDGGIIDTYCGTAQWQQFYTHGQTMASGQNLQTAVQVCYYADTQPWCWGGTHGYENSNFYNLYSTDNNRVIYPGTHYYPSDELNQIYSGSEMQVGANWWLILSGTAYDEVYLVNNDFANS